MERAEPTQSFCTWLATLYTWDSLRRSSHRTGCIHNQDWFPTIRATQMFADVVLIRVGNATALAGDIYHLGGSISVLLISPHSRKQEANGGHGGKSNDAEFNQRHFRGRIRRIVATRPRIAWTNP